LQTGTALATPIQSTSETPANYNENACCVERDGMGACEEREGEIREGIPGGGFGGAPPSAPPAGGAARAALQRTACEAAWEMQK
jgi:hypothetical protein